MTHQIADHTQSGDPYYPKIYAIRPNRNHRAKGRLAQLLPAHAYGSFNKHNMIHPPKESIVWVQKISWVRWYLSKSRTIGRMQI